MDWISSTSCLYTSCNAIVLWWPSSPTSDQSNINHTPGTGEGIGWLGGQTMVSVALRTFTPPWMYCRHMLAHRDLCWFTATCFIASTLTACFSVASVVGYTHMCMQRQKGKKQTVQSLVSISFSFHRHPDGSTCGSLCIFSSGHIYFWHLNSVMWFVFWLCALQCCFLRNQITPGVNWVQR